MDTTTDNLSQPFWAAAARHTLVRPRCKHCGASFFTPQIACPKCNSEDWQWAQSTGLGSIYSKSTVHKAPGPEFKLPYVLAIVQLDEGWNMLSNIVDVAPQDVRIGMRVKVVFQPGPSGALIPLFAPDGNRT